jgi:hypothetical protein
MYTSQLSEKCWLCLRTRGKKRKEKERKEEQKNM